ncbi:MAG: hypothetical protein OEW39_09815 [Deltaproteobacteria bacterium]|nr:hypothetical protein [Deltaproteobacteria bacterium]
MLATHITVYGLLGYARDFRLALDTLDLEELEPGEEFTHDGRIYEIRSVYQKEGEVLINVTLTGSQIGL